MLQVNKITKAFGGLMAPINVTFSIEEGEEVGLTGPNGSGKSTSFNVITRTFPPTSGHVIFRGEDITALPSHQFSVGGIAWTSQLVKPFLRLTTLQNVMAGPPYGHKPVTSHAQMAKREA